MWYKRSNLLLFFGLSKQIKVQYREMLKSHQGNKMKYFLFFSKSYLGYDGAVSLG